MKNWFKQVKCKPSPKNASLHEESTLLTSPPSAASELHAGLGRKEGGVGQSDRLIMKNRFKRALILT